MSETSTSARDRYRHWPDLQFHYGLSFEELRAMPHARRAQYEEALPRLLAERQAQLLDVISFPHMEKAGQRRIVRALNAALGLDEPVVPQGRNEAQAKAGAMGIGIRTVPAKKSRGDKI